MAKNERKIIVTASRIVTSGTNVKGNAYQIYELEATREDHTPIPEDMKLRSFDDLPLHQPLDVVIEPFNSDKYGLSYTVKLKGGNRQNNGVLQKQVNELTEKVEELYRRVAGLADRVYSKSPASTPPASTPGPPTPAPTGETPGGGIPTDDDIPF